jgi:tripartite-type tricarboxylate transporter receptor subunit TctC
VTTLARVAQLPELPTIDESGVPGYDVATWIGAFAPAGTPEPIVRRIEADIRRSLAMPDIGGKLEALHMQIRSGAGAELRALLAHDIARWSRLVQEQNIRIAP